jgi:hypothetical protein
VYLYIYGQRIDKNRFGNDNLKTHWFLPCVSGRFNRISGRSERLHDSQIHAYFYVWADHSCHVVETNFDSMHIESKNEPVSPQGL